MIRLFFLITIVCLIDSLAAQNKGLVPIFDGKSLDGWNGNIKYWNVEDECIVGHIPANTSLNRNEFLFWNGETADFDLRLKYKISGHQTANSGVQFRSRKSSDGNAIGYQADLDKGDTWAGRIYDEHGRGLILERGTKVSIFNDGSRKESVFRKPEEYRQIVKQDSWNDYRVQGIGNHIRIWINGKLAADLIDDQKGQRDLTGKLALQLHSGPGPVTLQFKDIKMNQLGVTEDEEIIPLVRASRKGVSPSGKNLGFENGTLEGWTAEGEVWKKNPVKGDTVTARGRGQASNHDGDFWVGGYELTESDIPRGNLTSDPFEVTHPWGSFLIGGGSGKNTRVDILNATDNSVIHSASGKQIETMEIEWVDLRKFQNSKIKIKVIDNSSGPWGHINFDDFRFHNKRVSNQALRVSTNPILEHLVPNPAVGQNVDITVLDMWVPEGFKVERIAKEPTVTQPIAFTFDDKGRMWIAEAHAYPRRKPEGEGVDRIIILEDRDGNGSFESKKIFAEGLNLVSGLEVGYGGVWVGAAPYFMFIPDKNQDDVPDGKPEILLDGWGYQDTHETLNSFIWGPDGWLYGNQGVFCRSEIGKPGSKPEERILLRSGVWRYHPIKHEFEIYAIGGSNQWGIDFNEKGHMFITHCRSAWGGGPTTYVVANGHYWNQSNNHHAPFVASGPPSYNPKADGLFRNFLLSSAGYGHGEGGAGKPGSRNIYGGHSHIGSMIYLGENWPSQYRDQLFTHNLHGHQMNRQINQRKGSGYKTIHSGSDHLYAPAPEFIAVDLKYGPHGAVYLIDWSDKQHCHTTNTEIWDRSDGGVFRMSWQKTFSLHSIHLSSLPSGKLVELVTSKNEWMSRMARRILHERQDKSIIPLLQSKIKNTNSVPETLRLLWCLHLLGDTKIYSEFINHDDESVRSWVIHLAYENKTPDFKTIQKLASNDSSAMVRLAIASNLKKLSKDQRWTIGSILAHRVEDVDDAYIPKMIWYSLAQDSLGRESESIELAYATPMKDLSDSIFWFLSKNSKGREDLLKDLVAHRNASDAERLFKLMYEGISTSKNVPVPPSWSVAVTKFQTPKSRSSIDSLSTIFGDQNALSRMRSIVVDNKIPSDQRQAALQSLLNQGDLKILPQLISLLKDNEMQGRAISALSRFNDPLVAESIIPLLSSLNGRARESAMRTLSSQPKSAEALLKAISNGIVDKRLMTSLHARQILNLANPTLADEVNKVWGRVLNQSGDTRTKISKLVNVYDKFDRSKINNAAGKKLYLQLCANCHIIGSEGINLGPELTGAGTNGAQYFIENIVDPNSVIGESFQLNIVTKKDGSVISGMPASVTTDSITIRTLESFITIPQNEIKERNILEQSMMPPGLIDGLSNQQMVDLIGFLVTQ